MYTTSTLHYTTVAPIDINTTVTVVRCLCIKLDFVIHRKRDDALQVTAEYDLKRLAKRRSGTFDQSVANHHG